MKKLIITTLVVILLLLPVTLAQEDFTAQAKSLYSLEKCVSEKNIITLTNTGTQTNNYLIAGAGKTKDWVQYPGMFSIEPGKTVNVETIIAIPCVIPAGNYQLIHLVSTTTGLEKEIIQDLVVEDTQNIIVTVDSTEKTIKPCTEAAYSLKITNPSSFQEKYKLSIDNPDAELSTEEITINPNETKQITLTFEPTDCFQTGEKTLLFSAETEKTKLIAELDLFVEIQNYGLPEIASGVNKIRTYYNENIVDLEILNKGEEDTSYIVSVTGADWITVSPRILSVERGKTEEITLNLAPTSEIKKGKYPIKISAELEETGAKYEKEIIVKLTTHGVIDNLFDKYLPLTVLIIIALIVFGIISVYAIQHMSTEEYQKQKLKRLKEKEKLKKQREREKARKKKEKERLKKERANEKKRIKEERQKQKEKKMREKERKKEAKLRLKAQKEKDLERKRKEKEKEEKKRAQTYQKELRKEYHIIARKDIIAGKQERKIFSKLLFVLILLVLLVIAIVFIKPIINNVKYVLLGIILLILLFILGKIRRKRIVKTKWKGISLAKEKKIFDINWKKGLQQIKIKLETPIKNFAAKVKKGRGRNERYICIDEHIYQYFRTETNTDQENISETEITFKVPQKWLKNKKIDEEEVALYYLDNGEWKEIETEKTGWDEKYVFFKAYAEKLGQFAIIGTETAEEIKEEKPKKSKGILALIGIIVIALLIFLLLKPASIEPTAGIPTQTWLQGEQQSLDLNDYFKDPDGDLLEFSALNEVENIDIWFKDGIAYLTPDADFTGERTIIFAADDNKGGYAESNPVKLIVKNKVMNSTSKIIKYGLGIIILLAIITVIIKFILMIRENLRDD
ncbi:PGF-pre-PGF domain-containing protein [Candidatus Woesearchaeota archaeon]|nr:PGF-pre-PGF domain-containing protein [Candidatus Woesearchaeota archaeon]